jgi:hypothetical protein
MFAYGNMHREMVGLRLKRNFGINLVARWRCNSWMKLKYWANAHGWQMEAPRMKRK